MEQKVRVKKVNSDGTAQVLHIRQSACSGDCHQCAGCGAAEGIAYLRGGRFEVIAHTVANALAICSGMICDGAKPSCAAKIASAVDAGLMGYHMYVNGGHQFVGGEGIIKKGVENTIDNVGRLARMGMRKTDEEILNIMVGQ